jgi:protein kinase A/protein kinase X
MSIAKNEYLQLVETIRNKKDIAIKDFVLGGALGKGTFGTVMQGEFKYHTSNHVFALKILKKEQLIKLKQVEHIKSEKEILSFVSHPFIVELITAFKSSKNIYLVFEFLSGGELFTRLRSVGRFSEEVALFYTTQITLAIRYLHMNDIIYR